MNFPKTLFRTAEEMGHLLEIALIWEFLSSSEKLKLLRAEFAPEGCIDMVEYILKAVEYCQRGFLPARGKLDHTIREIIKGPMLADYQRKYILWNYLDRVRFILLEWYLQQISDEMRRELPSVLYFDPESPYTPYDLRRTGQFPIARSFTVQYVLEVKDVVRDINLTDLREIDDAAIHKLRMRLGIPKLPK